MQFTKGDKGEIEGVNFLGKKLKSPLLGTSGTVGYGNDFKQLISLEQFGGLVFKTLTPKPLAGNPHPRVCEVEAGMINSIGLQNPGIDNFIENIYPEINFSSEVIVISLAAFTIKDFVGLIKKVAPLKKIDFIELNVSCPNLDYHGKEFATDKKLLKDLIIACKKIKSQPLIIKLSPNVTSISELAMACEEAGADALTIGNTFKGMRIDVVKQIPLIAKVTGGLSGPAIKPLMLAKVYEASQTTHLPIIGVGGVTHGDDVIEYLLAGATLVGLGTVNLIDPRISKKIFKQMQKYLKKNRTNVQDLTGKLQADFYL